MPISNTWIPSGIAVLALSVPPMSMEGPYSCMESPWVILVQEQRYRSGGLPRFLSVARISLQGWRILGGVSAGTTMIGSSLQSLQLQQRCHHFMPLRATVFL